MSSTVYFLGAGFSRYAGLPLVKDFFSKSKAIYQGLDKNNEFEKKIFEKVLNYFENFSRVKHIMKSDFFNIEELLSIIEMDEFITKDKIDIETYIKFIELVISKLTPGKRNKNWTYFIDNEKTTEVYSRFIKYAYNITVFQNDGQNIYELKETNNTNGIISLNYDLLLEKSLEYLNEKNKRILTRNYHSFGFEYGLNKDYLFDIQDEPRYPKLKFAKIHGSLNFSHRENSNIKMIVPPTWNKLSGKNMKPVWELAHELIKNSRKIVFIGYSLPITDVYIKYLLISGIQKSIDVEKEIEVICVDPTGDIEKRYRDFFETDSISFNFIKEKFEDWFKPVPDPEEEIKYAISTSKFSDKG